MSIARRCATEHDPLSVNSEDHERHRRGLIAYALLKAMSGRAREVSTPMWVAAGAFVIYFADPWIRQFVR